MSIGTNIKRYREQAGMTQAELANKMGISDKTISSWEIDRTEPKMGKVEQLARVLGCQKSDIIGADGKAETLSAEEKALMADYRMLSSEGKKSVRDYMEFTKSKEKEKCVLISAG